MILTVRQTQTAEPYRLSLDVGVVPAAGALPAVRQMKIDGRETTVRIPAAAEPVEVVLDPTVSTLAEFGAFAKVQPSGGFPGRRGPADLRS